MNTHRISILVVLVGIQGGCSHEHDRLPNGTTGIKGNGEGFNVHYVHERDGTLLYAFVADPALEVISTNDANLRPSTTGVHWLTNSRDGVWFRGNQVTMPVDSPVFAIRKDGSIHSVRCSDEQISAISPGGGIFDPAFVEDTLKPALGLQVN